MGNFFTFSSLSKLRHASAFIFPVSLWPEVRFSPPCTPLPPLFPCFFHSLLIFFNSFCWLRIPLKFLSLFSSFKSLHHRFLLGTSFFPKLFASMPVKATLYQDQTLEFQNGAERFMKSSLSSATIAISILNLLFIHLIDWGMSALWTRFVLPIFWFCLDLNWLLLVWIWVYLLIIWWIVSASKISGSKKKMEKWKIETKM